MSARLVDGKGIADAILANLKTELDALAEPLHLAAVCIGDDEGVRGFVKVKQRAAQSVGVIFSSYLFEADDHTGALDTLRFLAADEGVHGIFVELPLPADWDREEVLALIPPAKDVDALTRRARVSAPAVKALEHVLMETGTEVGGRRAAVVGYGMLVGRPVADWLRGQGAQVDVIDVDTPEPERIARNADVIVAGAGVPGLVTGDWVKEGALVVDFGFAKKGSAYVGDVELESVQKKAGFMTPVPGGMGPLVVAAVLENLISLATR